MDYIVQFLNYFLQNILLPVFPKEFSFLTLTELSSHFSNIRLFLVSSLSGITYFFSGTLLFIVITSIISIEVILFTFRTLKYLLNLVRGAGA